MKAKLNIMLMATLMLGLGIGITSCSDSDDDNKSSQDDNLIRMKQALDPYEKNTSQGMALLMLVSQLADVDSLPDNWKTATFEPMRGIVKDESQPFIRYSVVNGVNECRNLFQSLSGQNISKGTQTASWQHDGIGTMRFTVLDQSDCFATIDLDIKQMPHLTQLRLVPASAIGSNALKKASYYRIGDLIRDNDDRRWVCVRAAGYDSNDKEDKKTTYWVTLKLNEDYGMMTKNIKTILGDDKHRVTHTLPTQLGGSDARPLQWFAELMWVLEHPEDYEKNMGPGQPFEFGLGGLGTDRKADQNAYDPEYVKKLAAKWKDGNERLWNTFLPGSISRKDLFANNYLNIFYNGYSTEFFGSNVTLYLCRQGGNCFSEQTLSQVTWDMDKTWGQRSIVKDDNIYWFDIREYSGAGHVTNGYAPQGIKDAIVVVQATGKQINDSFLQPDYDKPFNENRLASTPFCGNKDLK
jgi:hypothetical protein